MFGEGIDAPASGRTYFPFTEPSAEVDLDCFVCRGASQPAVETVPHLRRARAGSSGAAAAW